MPGPCSGIVTFRWGETGSEHKTMLDSDKCCVKKTKLRKMRVMGWEELEASLEKLIREAICTERPMDENESGMGRFLWKPYEIVKEGRVVCLSLQMRELGLQRSNDLLKRQSEFEHMGLPASIGDRDFGLKWFFFPSETQTSFALGSWKFFSSWTLFNSACAPREWGGKWELSRVPQV